MNQNGICESTTILSSNILIRKLTAGNLDVKTISKKLCF